MPLAGNRRCRKFRSTAESCSEPWISTTTGTLLLHRGMTSRPTSFAPWLSKDELCTSNGMRRPLSLPNTMVPLSQTNEMALPSGFSVQPDVLVQVPSFCR